MSSPELTLKQCFKLFFNFSDKNLADSNLDFSQIFGFLTLHVILLDLLSVFLRFVFLHNECS